MFLCCSCWRKGDRTSRQYKLCGTGLLICKERYSSACKWNNKRPKVQFIHLNLCLGVWLLADLCSWASEKKAATCWGCGSASNRPYAGRGHKDFAFHVWNEAVQSWAIHSTSVESMCSYFELSHLLSIKSLHCTCLIPKLNSTQITCVTFCIHLSYVFIRYFVMLMVGYWSDGC